MAEKTNEKTFFVDDLQFSDSGFQILWTSVQEDSPIPQHGVLSFSIDQFGNIETDSECMSKESCAKILMAMLDEGFATEQFMKEGRTDLPE